VGKTIVHRNLSIEELEVRFQGFGMPDNYSKMMSSLDTAIKHGSENRSNDVVLALTGRTPKTFAEWARSSKSVWL
jgi:festuclavine dehydrogenase